jgi:hypothetical protein
MRNLFELVRDPNEAVGSGDHVHSDIRTLLSLAFGLLFVLGLDFLGGLLSLLASTFGCFAVNARKLALLLLFFALQSRLLVLRLFILAQFEVSHIS